MSGHRVINSPSSHMYAATKFAVRAITDGLRYELNNLKSHVRVTVSNTPTYDISPRKRHYFNARP